MKNKSRSLSEPVAEQGYKKAFLQRQIEEEETKKILREWRKVLRNLAEYDEDGKQKPL